VNSTGSRLLKNDSEAVIPSEARNLPVAIKNLWGFSLAGRIAFSAPE
jgi:hypothetical protein